MPSPGPEQIIDPEGPAPSKAPIRIAISACILGEGVRFDGGHKLDKFLRDTFAPYVEFVPLCPEMEMGLGVPRETLRLLADGPEESGGVRLVGGRSGTDHTTAMLTYAREKIRYLQTLDLQGAIVQKGSPSCGLERVRIYPAGGTGVPTKDGAGVFTHALQTMLPRLPVEEDGRMNDPVLRENFIGRVFAYRRLRDLFQSRWHLREVVGFHTREKLLLLSHDRPTYTRLGRLVAGAKALGRAEFAAAYEREFMTGLGHIATRKKNTDVLQHMTGHLRKLLEDSDREELRDTIERYRVGEMPLIVPVTLLRHHVRRHRVSYLEGQTYLAPHPRELSLRNHG